MLEIQFSLINMVNIHSVHIFYQKIIPKSHDLSSHCLVNFEARPQQAGVMEPETCLLLDASQGKIQLSYPPGYLVDHYV